MATRRRCATIGVMPARTSNPVRLVLAYDGSDAAADAIRVAGRLFPGADAVVVHHRDEPDVLAHAALARIVWPDAVTIGAVREYERLRTLQSSELAERGREIARRAGLQASCEVRSAGSAWRAVLDAADDDAADVIVCGTRGRGPLARAWLGSTSSSLVHHAERPLLVVPPGTGDADGPTLIGYDGSDGARAAITAAAGLLPGRPALVVHAWSSAIERSFAGSALLATPIPEVRDTAADLDALFTGNAEETAEEGAELARQAGLEARGRAVESSPSAWRTLAVTAREEDAAIIVTGARGRGALAATLLGSVSSALVHNAETPVLVAREPRP
jgi:nucleotide-binding universal stress UspA family protein